MFSTMEIREFHFESCGFAAAKMEVRALSDTCAVHELIEASVRVWRASRQGRAARAEK